MTNTHKSLIERIDNVLSHASFNDAIDVDLETLFNDTRDAIDDTHDDATRACLRVALRAIVYAMTCVENDLPLIDDDALMQS